MYTNPNATLTFSHIPDVLLFRLCYLKIVRHNMLTVGPYSFLTYLVLSMHVPPFSGTLVQKCAFWKEAVSRGSMQCHSCNILPIFVRQGQTNTILTKPLKQIECTDLRFRFYNTYYLIPSSSDRLSVNMSNSVRISSSENSIV